MDNDPRMITKVELPSVNVTVTEHTGTAIPTTTTYVKNNAVNLLTKTFHDEDGVTKIHDWSAVWVYSGNNIEVVQQYDTTRIVLRSNKMSDGYWIENEILIPGLTIERLEQVVRFARMAQQDEEAQ